MNKRTLVPALVLAAAAATPAVSMAQGSGNIGFVTDYVFRGQYQAASSAYAGADYATDSGFYLGTWWADVGVGTETDIYFGFAGGGDSFTYKIGYTGYLYLDDYDGDYGEVNLGLGVGIFALDVAIGTYDSDVNFGLGDQDYEYASITIAPEAGPYYKYGIWMGDYADNILPILTQDGTDDGGYLEVGYAWSFEEQGIDLSATLVTSSDLNVAGASTSAGDVADYVLTFGIKKTFAP